MTEFVQANLNVKLEKVNASDVEQLTFIQFERCDMSQSTIKACNLSNVHIEDCNISGLTIDGASIEELLNLYKEMKGKNT